jgi:uncharacterized membrane protein YfcA
MDGLRIVDQGNIVHATDATGLVVVTQLQPISVIFTLPEDQLAAVKSAMAAGPVAIFAMSAAWLGTEGTIATDTVWMFFIGLPVLLAGTWLGLRLYGRHDEAGFRKLILTLLLVSGITLIL